MEIKKLIGAILFLSLISLGSVAFYSYRQERQKEVQEIHEKIEKVKEDLKKSYFDEMPEPSPSEKG